MGNRGWSLWDEQDGFFYDILRLGQGRHERVRIRPPSQNTAANGTGGSIVVTSEAGRGTEIRITLPLDGAAPSAVHSDNNKRS